MEATHYCAACWRTLLAAPGFDANLAECPGCQSQAVQVFDPTPGLRFVLCECGARGQGRTGDACPGCDEVLVRITPTDMFDAANV